MIKYLSTAATISDCGQYRYRLERHWGDGPTALWVMLNPSTADSSNDDRTIGRCVGFSVREGCGRMLVGNLYALRSTDPAALLEHDQPVGWENFEHLRAMAKEASVIVVAWGSWKGVTPQLVKSVLESLAGAATIRCLGRTKSGAPKHPLYVAGSTPLEDFLL
jgi:hypothetical protein